MVDIILEHCPLMIMEAAEGSAQLRMDTKAHSHSSQLPPSVAGFADEPLRSDKMLHRD